MPSESPTRMTSMPACSTSRANAASYAVIIVMRLPSRFIATSSGTVTFLAIAGAPPYAEPADGCLASMSYLRPGRPLPVPASSQCYRWPTTSQISFQLIDHARQECQVAQHARGRGLERLAVPVDEDRPVAESSGRSHVVILARTDMNGVTGRHAGALGEHPPVSRRRLVAATVL